MSDATNKATETVPTVHVAAAPAHTPEWVEIAHGVESIFTTLGLLVAAWWAWRGDWRKSRAERTRELQLREREEDGRREALKQRQDQLRWDQARMAREIIREFLNDADAQTALNLVDCDTEVFRARDEKTNTHPYDFNLERKEDVRAMRVETAGLSIDLSTEEVFLRRCFDAWFFWMAVIEEHLHSKLILPDDVDFVCRYYVRCLAEDPGLYKACLVYIEHYEIGAKVLKFIARYASQSG